MENFCVHFVDTRRFTIRPVTGHGIEGVCKSEDPGPKWNIVSRQPVWIAFAVIPFMMVTDKDTGGLQELDLGEHLLSPDSVGLNDGVLIIGQASGFEEN